MTDASRMSRPEFAKTIGIAAAGAALPVWASARTMATPQNALDHVVVLMFENRSFDNVLGRLYQPGEVAAFEGVLGKDLRNSIPAWAEHGAERGFVPYGVAANMNTPDPDPGEEYPHINTDIYGVSAPDNRFVELSKMVAPFNAPAAGQTPTMDGFVADYISTFTSEMGRQPTYDEYAQIMTGYTPQQMPVLSTLARNFAVFDHWFCEVPSQTFTNRSFFHAATASGFVINFPPATAFPVHNTAETIFERLKAKGLTWRVYCDAPSPASYTGRIHASRLRERFASHFFTVDDFVEDAKNGRLPAYAFIEPDMWAGHNDMHPPISALLHGAKFDAPSSLLGGEMLLAKVYDAIRTSESPSGSTRSTRCCSLRSTKPAARTTTSPRPLRSRRPPMLRRGKWDSRSTASACSSGDCDLAVDLGADGGDRQLPAYLAHSYVARPLVAWCAVDRPRCRRAEPRAGSVADHAARSQGLAPSPPAARATVRLCDLRAGPPARHARQGSILQHSCV